MLNSGHTCDDYELQLSYMVFPRLGDSAVVEVGATNASTRPADAARRALSSGVFDEAWEGVIVP